MSARVKVRKMAFYDAFKCATSACRSTCCTGDWAIFVTKSEYNRLRNAEFSPETQVLIDDYVKRIKPAVKDAMYAQFKLVPGEYCPFLNDEKMCKMQIDCGYSVLTKVCKFYPRVHSEYNGNNISLSVSSSCEVVAKLLMESEEATKIIFDEIIYETISDIPPAYATYSSELIERFPKLKHYYEITEHGVNILRTNDFKIEDRLILLGYSLQKIDKLVKENSHDEIENFINKFNNISYQDAVLGALGEITPSYQLGLATHVMVLINQYEMMKINGRTGEDFVSVALKIINRYTVGEIDRNYEENGKMNLTATYDTPKYYEDLNNLDKYLEGREYIMSNFAINTFFTFLFPFTLLDVDIWYNYVVFAHLYATMRFFIASWLAINVEEGKSTREDLDIVIEDALVSFSRKILHSVSFMKNIYTKLKDTGTDTLAHMALLIKS